MRALTTLSLLLLTLPTHAATRATPDQLLQAHFTKYAALEYFSGASLSISIPNQPMQNYYIGQVSHEKNSLKVSPLTLFQIGSITKSFTAAVMLQLESENKFKLSDPIKQWFPEYDKWGAVKVEQLLNMTSGLPNYSDTPLWNVEAFMHPEHSWSSRELVAFAYPKGDFSPPLKREFYYSNTGYVLSDMIVEKLTNRPFGAELTDRTIKKAELANTFYPLPSLDQAIKKRLAHGYSYNQYDNPWMVGADISNRDLSWAAAAGGIISTSEDVVKWVKALFMDETILNSKQKQKLTQMVSSTSGLPITMTSAENPRGFGLGVSQAYDKNKDVGRFWFYEGQTLGFRALYMYVPCNGVIIASIFNSATNDENDHASELMKKTYQLILNQYPMLSCEPAKINFSV